MGWQSQRVSVEDRSGVRWLLRPLAATRDSVEHLMQVQEDLERMPITPFREKYRALGDGDGQCITVTYKREVQHR